MNIKKIVKEYLFLTLAIFLLTSFKGLGLGYSLLDLLFGATVTSPLFMVIYRVPRLVKWVLNKTGFRPKSTRQKAMDEVLKHAKKQGELKRETFLEEV